MKLKRVRVIGKSLVVLSFISFAVVFMANCKDDQDDDNENTDMLAPSEKQLHVFTQGTAGFYYNPPTLVNNYVYVGTSRANTYAPANDNAFYKLDNSLNKIWEYPLGSKEVRGAATLDDPGNIYFAVGERNGSVSVIDLYSLDSDGHFRWSKNVSAYSPYGGMFCPAISEDSIIYIGGDSLYAFDINGNKLWSYAPTAYFPNTPITNAPIIDPQGNIYFVFVNTLVSLDKNGSERWTYNSAEAGSGFGSMGYGSPAFSVDYSKVYVAIYKSVYCLGSMYGDLVWKYNDPDMIGDFRATPAVDENNNVYIGNHGVSGDGMQSMYAIQQNGSGLLWKTTIGSDLYSSPAIDNNHVLYVGSEGHGKTGSIYNRLHAMNMATGAILWSAQLEMDITFSSPAITNDGTLFISSMDMYGDNKKGMVYSFSTNSSGLLQNSGSSRFHEGNASTGRRE